MQKHSIREWTFMAVFAALAIVGTILIRIPVPATQGYIHLGDTILVLSALMLGRYKGSFAGAFGQGLADLMGGYAIFAPITLVSKFLMGITIYTAFHRFARWREGRSTGDLIQAVLFLVLSFVCMAGTYYLAESAMYGSLLVPLVEIPANLIQFGMGTIIAAVVAGMLKKTPARQYFQEGPC